MLIAGRELGYLKRFQNCEAVNSRAFTNESKETCARAYGMPGALRAGFEYYRAFPNDVKANQEFAKRKLTTPVLGIGGSGSFRPIIGDHLQHVANNVQAHQRRRLRPLGGRGTTSRRHRRSNKIPAACTLSEKGRQNA